MGEKVVEIRRFSLGKRGNPGQTFLWAKSQCIIMCVLVFSCEAARVNLLP